MIKRPSRRELFWLAGALATTRRFAAAEPAIYYRDYSKCLPEHLAALAGQAYERRNRELAKLTDATAIQERQKWARETLWRLVGGRPERTPLHTRVTGKFDRPEYGVEKLVYETRPGIFVSANLYLPNGAAERYPGVLFQMGHSALGKAYASYQKCCQGLARLGYVVLAFDPMGQGERIAYPDASGMNTRLSSVDEEHSRPGKQMLLLRDTASRWLLWDAIRSLDVLASHPKVDGQRLASAGQSGGGTLTMLLACVDERLTAAAVGSGNTENFACADFDAPGSTDDAEQNFIGSAEVGFDRWDLLYPLAPRPLLVLVSERDFFGTYSPRYLSSGREEFEKLARVYALLGKPDHLAWRDTPLPHALSYSMRLDIYNWFERWLKGSDRRIETEPQVALEPPKALWVGATGSVFRDFGSSRPFDAIKRAAADLRQGESAPSFPKPDAKLSILARTPAGGAHVEAVEVHSADCVWIPAWLCMPDATSQGRILLLLDDRGRNWGVHEDGLYQSLARRGHVVCAADIRGLGDMQPEVGRGNPDYTAPHDSEEDYAWASLILGESLLRQRVQDVLALLQALKNETRFAGRRIAIAARGCLTVPALFAFSASSIPDGLYLAGGLVSYRSVLETEEYRAPLSNFEWNIFSKTDLPVLAARAAPRRVHLAGTIDASGKLLDEDSVRRLYISANVSASNQAAWDETALSRW
jgi:dienelactone hydrolase